MKNWTAIVEEIMRKVLGLSYPRACEVIEEYLRFAYEEGFKAATPPAVQEVVQVLQPSVRDLFAMHCPAEWVTSAYESSFYGLHDALVKRGLRPAQDKKDIKDVERAELEARIRYEYADAMMAVRGRVP